MFIRIPLLALFTGTLFMLVSCQPNDTVTPAQSGSVSSQNLREGFLPTFPKHYQLTKHGEATLSYFDDGRLRKVVHTGTSVRGGMGLYTLYIYSAHSVVTKTYNGNSFIQEIKFLLDANTGYCYESQQIDYIPYGPNTTLAQETGYLYQYDGNGRLKSRTNKKYTYEKTDFIYNAGGDLSKIISYDKANGNPGVVVVSEAALSYDQPTGDPILSDLYPLNGEAANLPDTYLRIFGKSGKHLVKLVTEKYSSKGQYYTYVLNSDGYVTTRNTYNVSGGTLANTQAYEYLVTNLVVQL
ncbi:hypothetical protein [Salmonirosea aquatica]|uniref:DUF4595 domain-containing protein n=1 Tax=Salmonirosea aquatica TaxID=2654236 RepID=A0A7C9BFA2_9BACT|nr:hypothetical protein [Cytophagaceae bacterium SJW1-29]